ncbi:MAG TPA: hypothetical protein VFM64_04080 [Candidatus Nitrosotenuis sp.]|nr:hypothetical protein [Candidatus Nitrosotenuis sp.]
MDYPLASEEKGLKIVPELMEKEKMYYCIHNEKVLMVFKDSQEFLNCYEIEEEEVVNAVKKCTTPGDIEKEIENYISKQNLKH